MHGPFTDDGTMGTFRSTSDIAIHVADLEAARRFYTDVMGFTLVRKSETRAVFWTGALVLYVLLDPDHAVGPVPALEVDDLVGSRERLDRAGARITREWTSSRAIYVEDPFGVTWDVVEP